MNKTDYTKPKNQGVKFDYLELGTNYAFTINPKQECKSSNIKGFYRDQWNALRSLVKGCVMLLHLEASPSGRLHWHGYIKIFNILDFRSFLVALALHGTYVIKDMKEFLNSKEGANHWEVYINKQSKIWSIEVGKWKDPNLAYPMVVDPCLSPLALPSDI